MRQALRPGKVELGEDDRLVFDEFQCGPRCGQLVRDRRESARKRVEGLRRGLGTAVAALLLLVLLLLAVLA